jgi:hypothetical protein
LVAGPEANQIIEQLIAADQTGYENFVELNPDIMLPVDLDSNCAQSLNLLEGDEADCRVYNLITSPDETIKFQEYLPLGQR